MYQNDTWLKLSDLKSFSNPGISTVSNRRYSYVTIKEKEVDQ